MPVIASAETAGPTRRRASSNGTGFWLTSYIGATRYAPDADGTPGPDALYPVAFLVEQDPGATVGAHFHQADQFQVVVGGSGRLGQHDVAVGTVHFAGAWSAYGPLGAGDQGLQYFTLRNGWDPGARYMEVADNRALKRHAARAHREAVGSVTSATDGLCVQRHRLEAFERMTGPTPASGRGQFWVVLSGSLAHGAAVLPPRSCVFVAPEEVAFTATAGSDGLTVLSMQFPLP